MTTSQNDKTVSCLFNLVIYTHEEKRTEYFQHLFSRIYEKFPCRVIFIQQTTTSKEMVQKLQTNRESFGDQFIIQSLPEQLSQVGFVLLPLLIPDLPIYLIWGQNPAADKVILPQLHKFATRLVYDSECDQDLQSFSQTMLCKLGNISCDFMDIDWALISGWRDVISQIFDSQPRYEILLNCSSVEIKYNVLETPLPQRKATQSIYLQGWFAGQLKWEFQSLTRDKENLKIYYLNENNEITIMLRPTERNNLPAGAIIEISFLSMNDRCLSLSLDEKQSKVLVYLSTPEKCELPFSLPLPNLQRGLSFMKEIFYHRADQQYLNMLKAISEISWKENRDG
jgi:hypothetical protein